MSDLLELGRNCLVENGIDYIAMGEDELEHHGILGQKWGIRRFQNKDGSLTDEGRKRYAQMSDDEKKEYRESAVRSGDINKLVEVKDDLTNQELQQGLQRINLNKQLSDAAGSEERDAGEQKIRKLTQYMQTGTKMIDAAVSIYDAFDKIKRRYEDFENEDLRDDIDNGRLKDVMNNPKASAKDKSDAAKNAKYISEAEDQLKKSKEKENFYKKDEYTKALLDQNMTWINDNWEHMNDTQRQHFLDYGNFMNKASKYLSDGKFYTPGKGGLSEDKVRDLIIEEMRNNGVIP